MKHKRSIYIGRLSVLATLLVLAGCNSATPKLETESGQEAEVSDTNVAIPEPAASSPGAESIHAEESTASVGDTPQEIASPDDLAIPLEELDPHGPFAKRVERDTTVWKSEVLAQQYERALVTLWDSLLAEDRKADGDKFAVLANVEFDSIRLGQQISEEKWAHGISVRTFGGEPTETNKTDWASKVSDVKSQGFDLVQSEWHHATFDPETETTPARSTVNMTLYLERSGGEGSQQADEAANAKTRIVVDGKLTIEWKSRASESDIPVPATVDATQIRVLTREAAPAFRLVKTIEHTGDNRSGVQPVLVHDINRDGHAEIMLAGSNELLENHGNFEFTTHTLCSHPEKIFETGIVADFNGDTFADLIVPGARGDLLMYAGDGELGFSATPTGKARGGGPLRQPQVITAGDIDKDGDLDLWIAQYKISYVDGQMPTPYYDANDGFPAFLLLNDGSGKFQPATEEAGLAEKRYRRTYGSSFVDIDENGTLDLVVVSDFSGVDVYTNDGTGYFTDVTTDMIDERHLFGMSATFADYNMDGRLDFFVSGMASTTARRLEYMRLGREDRPDVHLMRSRMGYGNRMYVAGEKGFSEPSFKDTVARTGWTWGATSFDFDNDGDKDIFVANGHSSGESTKDHCSHFWCHDIYDGTSKPDFSLDAVFKESMQGYYDRSESWDGYQKNVLLMNESGRTFRSIGFLLGVGQQFDGRAVIGDDLDSDGRVDLLVVEDQWRDGQKLHIFRNELPTEGHWIGFKLRESGNGVSPMGAMVRVFPKSDADDSNPTSQVACVLSGDSIHAQHATTVHFGLGTVAEISRAEIRWPNGTVQVIDAPQVDQYHVFQFLAE
ncbi:MAG: CRTAC1 family protein [Planctomycetales bacterium]|nr:CRTAC1 family protein [Planctomycetales bacterium]